METTYRHRQFGTITAFAMAAAVLVTAFLALTQPDGPGYLPLLALLTFAQLAFVSLTVEVGAQVLAVRFGVGWIRFHFPIDQIRSARPVRNRWFYGWGIRMTPHGWLFNVGGLDAVEVEFASGRRVRIGTDQPEALASAIRSRLSSG